MTSSSHRFAVCCLFLLFVILSVLNVDAMDELSPVSFQNALNNDDANSNSRTYASSDRAGCACKAPERQLLRANNNNYNNGGFTITSSWNQMILRVYMNDRICLPLWNHNFWI